VQVLRLPDVDAARARRQELPALARLASTGLAAKAAQSSGGPSARPRGPPLASVSCSSRCEGAWNERGTCSARHPPGARPPSRRGKSSRWPSIQCRAAFEKIRSTGRSGLQARMSPSTQITRDAGALEVAARASISGE
jgi:hypothetical protein